MIAWSDLGNQIFGCIGGYSGGGAFQLEKFIYKDSKFKTSDDSDLFLHSSDEEINLCETCQDEILKLNSEKIWLDVDNLVLRTKYKSSLKRKDGLLYGGVDMPGQFKLLISMIGLISKPK